MNKGIVLTDAKGNKYYTEPYYEIGDLFFTTNNKNPETRFGGDWTLWGAGRVPVCVNTAETEFNTIEKTGGEKTHKLTVAELPPHTHNAGTINDSGVQNGSNAHYINNTKKNYATSSTGSGTAHNNLQPYITCYIWKRIA